MMGLTKRVKNFRLTCTAQGRGPQSHIRGARQQNFLKITFGRAAEQVNLV